MINMFLDLTFDALSKEGLPVEIFQVVPKLEGVLKPPYALTLRKSARQKMMNTTL